MKVLILDAVTVAYVVQAAVLFWTRDWPQAFIILGYAVANCGLIWSLQ
jgi:uncharacterized integral membrane protein